MATEIKSGSAAANKLFGAALFTEAVKSHTFSNLMVDGAPKVVDGNKLDGRKQTAAGAPIVRITDLSKTKGDEVTMDLYHRLVGEPVMGDKKLEGRAMSLTSSQFSLKINQGRLAVDSGGKMTQQRTAQDLARIANSMLGNLVGDIFDQQTLVHLAGARGDMPQTAGDWVLPLDTAASFADIMVNPVLPPTFDRHTFAGDNTSVSGLDTTDKFNLRCVNKLRLLLDTQASPLQSVRYEGDAGSNDQPFYILYISPRQWFDWEEDTSADFGGQALRRLQANAVERGKMFNHPIFTGGSALWNNILIKKMSRTIQFSAGYAVPVCNDTDAATTSTSAVAGGVTVNRAILLGAQALADAWGITGAAENGGYHFSMNTELKDHGNTKEHSIAYMGGKSKVRFALSGGRVNDHGVMVLDTAVSA